MSRTWAGIRGGGNSRRFSQTCRDWLDTTANCLSQSSFGPFPGPGTERYLLVGLVLGIFEGLEFELTAELSSARRPYL